MDRTRGSYTLATNVTNATEPMTRPALALLTALSLALGCSSDPDLAPVDSGSDTSDDVAVDAVSDSSEDAEADATADAKADATPDTEADATSDAVADVTPDAEADATPDAEADATPDAVADVTPDAEADASPDAEADATPDTDLPTTCPDLIAGVEAELVAIRSCDQPEDCGRAIPGTSCGCTRDLVARADADLARFEALMAEIGRQGCDFGFFSTCDCPPADGFTCVEGMCAWNYL